MTQKKKNAIIFTVIIIAVIGLVAAVVSLSIKLDRRTTNERLGAEAYSIGIIDFEGDVDKTVKTSIYTRNALELEGLTIELAEEAEITYSLFFYNAKDKFLGEGSSLDTPPTGATAVRIVIAPLDDDEVTLSEVDDYANQLIVRQER